MNVVPIGEPGMTAEKSADALMENPHPGPAPAVTTEHASLVVIGLFVLAVLYTFYFARALLLPIVLAVLFSLLLSPVVRMLRNFRVPEPAGAAIVVVCLLGGIGTGAYTLMDPATEWLTKAPGSLRLVESKLRKLKQPVADVQRAAERLEAIAQMDVPGKVREVVLQRPGIGDLMATRTPYLVAGALSTVVLLYFLLASGDLFLRKVVRVTPSLRNKIHAVEVGRSIQHDIGRYFFTVSLINLGLGMATALALYFLGMPNPLLWGAVVALLNFIPYLGPTTSLLILTVAAILAFDDLARAWSVPAVFLGLVFLEGQVIQPIVVGRRLSLNPVVVFVAFLALGWLWGVAGMFIAVPILVTLKVFCDHVERFAAIGEFLGR